MPPGFAAMARSMRGRTYRSYAVGFGVSLIGTWIQRVAVAWLTWELTRSGFWLGIIAFADLFPVVVLGIFSGALADRWDRLKITIVTEALALLQAIALVGLTLTGLINEWWLLWLSLFAGIVGALNQPARFALLPTLVPSADLTPAIALNSMTFNVARFIGPAIAGVIIVYWSVAAALIVNAATYVVFLILLAGLKLEPRKAPTAKSGFRADLLEGFATIWRHEGLGPLVLMLIVASVGARGIAELLPAYADHVGLAADGLAAFTSALGFGAILAGIWLGGRESNLGLLTVHRLMTLVLALCVAALAFITVPWIAILLFVIGGFAMSGIGIASQMLIYGAVEERMRGRALGVYGMIWRGGPAAGALAIGAIADQIGLPIPVFVGACIAILVCLLMPWKRMAVALHGERAPAGDK